MSDIAVTHSPRYKIDMNLPEEETIFDKMGISYDKLRESDNPIQPIVEYFRSTLKEGESLWWVNDSESMAPAKIRMWRTLSGEEQEGFIAQGFAMFPELFGNQANKYERFTLWLVANHSVLSPSMRDSFSAGGRESLVVNNKHYEKLPQKYKRLFDNREGILNFINEVDESILAEAWKQKCSPNRMEIWKKLIAVNVGEEQFDVVELLDDLFGKS